MRAGLWIASAFAACALAAQATSAVDYDPKALIKLAREAVVAEVAGKNPPKPETETRAKPVFVTIERNGVVLGCRGGLSARSSTLEYEVIAAARAAAAHDPRYRPLTPEDLKGFFVTVTVVARQAPIKRVDGLKPEQGLVLTSGGRTGVVLPWEGKDPKTRLKWAYRKAGVSQKARVSLFALFAERYRG